MSRFRAAIRHRSAAFCLLALAAVQGAVLAGRPQEFMTDDVRRAMESVRAENLSRHVRALADDAMEGRGTGTPGGERAADYLGSQMHELGLRPAGDVPSHFQSLALARARLDINALALEVRRGEDVVRIAGDELILASTSRHRVPKARGRLVFAGYGIRAPEFRHDDYAGLEAKGRWVVVLDGEPPSADPAVFEGERDTRHAGLMSKVREAEKEGACGVIAVYPHERQSRFNWARFRERTGRPAMVLTGGPPTTPVLLVREQAAGPLFAEERTPIERMRANPEEEAIRPGDLRAEAELELRVEMEPVKARNVVGLLPGGERGLKDEVVIYSAHYDHLGARRAANGEDGIYNGAWDNASGTAEVLEVARAFTRLRQRPRRSILFLLVSGEEHGLLGSRDYVRRPLVPLEKTAANINLDMTEIFGIPRSFNALGAERSSLIDNCRAAAQALGMELSPDPTPALGVFTRSDQFSFAEAGVPCVFLRWGTTYEDLAPEEARRRWEERMDRVYHRPGDAFDPSWSWEGMRRHTQAAFLVGLHVANQPQRPRWNEGEPYARVARRAPAP